MQSTQNLKMGFLFLLFLSLLFWATLMVKGGWKGLVTKGRTLVAELDNVENLKSGDKVLFAGVPVGKVTKIDFQPKQVFVHMTIMEETVKIFKGAEIIVEDVSTLGGKQVSRPSRTPRIPSSSSSRRTGRTSPPSWRTSRIRRRT
ncbi:MAG: MlaD family protein [Planctomycetota bacterium]|jgi:ABC-type transporter Mla subunit MlaD